MNGADDCKLCTALWQGLPTPLSAQGAFLAAAPGHAGCIVLQWCAAGSRPNPRSVALPTQPRRCSVTTLIRNTIAAAAIAALFAPAGFAQTTKGEQERIEKAKCERLVGIERLDC